MKEEGVVGKHDIAKMSSFKVVSILKGTVLTRGALWNETGVLALMFWSLFGIVFLLRPEGFSEIIGKEADIRAFLTMFSTLIGLLLSFYTALSLGRWWQMRLAVEAIQDCTKKLSGMISQGVTGDEVLLETINRYSRASLYLIFAASQHEDGMEPPIQKATDKGLLTQEETDKLRKLSPKMTFVQAEMLWVWLANVVTRLDEQGLTKGPPHYCALLGAVDGGRSGICHIQAYLDTPIPMGYVHLLCLMVKLHNVLLTILLSLTSVMLSGGRKGFQEVGVLRTAFRAFFMPFLYNAILILNSDVTDPFGGDPGDFEFEKFEVNMKTNGSGHKMAAEHLPVCLTKEKFEPACNKV